MVKAARPVIAAVLAGLCLLPVLRDGGALQGAVPDAAPPTPAATAAPRRVVSINLCTDQLAMLLAAPGQLVSVSDLARDRQYSVMADQAVAYTANRGLAEEVYLLKPDLVLAGRYTAQATVSMLQRLGIPVVVFDPAASLAEVRAGMMDMGHALGREPQAAAMLAAFDARLARIAPVSGPRPRAATYAANGYMSGSGSLVGDVIATAGFDHLADELGLPVGGFVPLESLVMASPDLVIMGDDLPGDSRAEEVLHHPALQALPGARTAIEDRDWFCGLPAVLGAVERLAETRAALGPRPGTAQP